MRTTVDSVMRRLRATRAVSDAQGLLVTSLRQLDSEYALLAKVRSEPGLTDILDELYGRLMEAFGDLGSVRGLRILDIACGSNSSRAPAVFHLRTKAGRRPIKSPSGHQYASVFEPWFCRILGTLGAVPVGVDRGDLSGERFQTYTLDLGAPGALDVLPSASFDGIQDSRLFGSPEFRAQFPRAEDRLAVAREIVAQERRLLKPDGVIIHSDAHSLSDQAAP